MNWCGKNISLGAPFMLLDEPTSNLDSLNEGINPFLKPKLSQFFWFLIENRL